LKAININSSTKTSQLNEEQVVAVCDGVSENYLVEGELRSVVGRNIKRLVDIGSYRGLRHKRGLPVNGQNTKNNSRTRKGKKKTIANKKKAV
jgi:small subunit ribosomal protein S13